MSGQIFEYLSVHNYSLFKNSFLNLSSWREKNMVPIHYNNHHKLEHDVPTQNHMNTDKKMEVNLQ